jgi:ferrochelatase
MRRAVVLFNLGGPSSQEDVYPFLKSLFSDPAVLPFPRWIRQPLATFIALSRTKTAQEIYQKLGGGSPLTANTQQQAEELEKVLGPDYKVFVAMRHAKPDISQAIANVKSFNPQTLVLLPLFPQFSTSTTGSCFQFWEKESRLQGVARQVTRVCCYPELEGFILALTEQIQEKLHIHEKNASPPLVVFSAHGLPTRLIQDGDPYQIQVEKTYKKILKKLNVGRPEPLEALLCYQSKVGRGQWTGPSLGSVLKKAGKNARAVIVVPLSFVSEHSETLVELDIEYAEKAQAWGVKSYTRVPTVGTHPAFIQGLASLVRAKQENFSCPGGWKKCWWRMK